MGCKQQIKHMIGGAACLLPMRTRLDPVRAREILEAASPCPAGTCVANHEVRLEYDLQIIIPAYNVERYIVECLDSLMAQETDHRCLVTIVNDGSTDRTTEILESYISRAQGYDQASLAATSPDDRKGERRISLELINQKNRGLSGARNRALQCIRGEYVMFLDSDDVLPPGAIRHLIDMARETKADLVQGSWYDFVTGSASQEMHTLSVDGLLEDNRGVFSGFPWGKLYRYTVLEHFQFPEGFWFEDTPVSFILAAMPWRCAATRELVYGYRKNPNGITATSANSAKALDSYWITERCLVEFPAYGLLYDQRAYEYFLRQAQMNWYRTKHQPRRVREAMFVLTAELRDQYFADMRIEVAELRAIEDAIRHRQFVRYEILMASE